MYKVLIVTLHRPNRSPSQRFRFEQYLDHLKQNGFEYEWSYLIDAKDDAIFYKPGRHFAKLLILIRSIFRRWREVRSKKHYDIVFVQRESFMLGTTFFEKRFSRKSKMIFDFDDSIWLQNVSDANRRFAFLKNPQKTAELIRMSDLVIAGNEYLAAYARKFNKNVEIIPTTIDTDEYQRISNPSKDPAICIGWSGSITTIQHFEFAIPILEKIKEKYGDRIRFKVIGDSNYRHEGLGIKGIAWSKDTELLDLSDIDIGLMPLPDDEWAQGKCGLKGLQYMALEIATIMSPVGVNSTIIQHGENGFLADGLDQWMETLSLLIDSPELREKIGKNGRATVVDHYSVHANAASYLAAFQSLVK